MGQAQKKSDSGGERKPHAILVEFAEKYEPLLAEAKQASQLTYEDAWANLYREELRMQRDVSKTIGTSLETLGKRMGDGMWIGEEDEKELGQLKKDAQELRQRKDNFEATTVGPIRGPVEKCDQLINEIMHKAAMAEEQTPLINRGLEDTVRDAIGAIYRPEWNAKTGQITLLVPKSEQ